MTSPKSILLVMLCFWLAGCTRSFPPAPRDIPGKSTAGNGGDGISLMFEQGRWQAAGIVERVSEKEMRGLGPEGLGSGEIDWILEHRDALAGDIRKSPHRWAPSLPTGKCPLETCACTLSSAPAAEIDFALGTCATTTHDRWEAATLLLHESLHHLFGPQESAVNRIASSLTNVWRRMGHSEETHWVPMPRRRWKYIEPKEPTYQHAVWTGSELFLWHLLRYDRMAQARYSPKEEQWKTRLLDSYPGVVIPEVPKIVPRDLPMDVPWEGGWTGGKLVAYTGPRAFYGNGPANPGFVYDPVDGWDLLPETGAPELGSRGFVRVANGKLLVWGGYDQWKGEGAIYDVTQRTWEPLAKAPDDVRPLSHYDEDLTVLWDGRFLFVYRGSKEWATGFRQFAPALAWVYDAETHRWMNVPSSPGPARIVTATMLNGEVFLLGDDEPRPEPDPFSYERHPRSHPKGAIFHLAKLQWREIDAKAIPRGYHRPGDHSAQHEPWPPNLYSGWNGDEVVVFAKDLVTFYDPRANRWRRERHFTRETESPDILSPGGKDGPIEIFWTGLEWVVWSTAHQRGYLLYP